MEYRNEVSKLGIKPVLLLLAQRGAAHSDPSLRDAPRTAGSGHRS
jgi:hypothetical protein